MGFKKVASYFKADQPNKLASKFYNNSEACKLNNIKHISVHLVEIKIKLTAIKFVLDAVLGAKLRATRFPFWKL